MDEDERGEAPAQPGAASGSSERKYLKRTVYQTLTGADGAEIGAEILELRKGLEYSLERLTTLINESDSTKAQITKLRAELDKANERLQAAQGAKRARTKLREPDLFDGSDKVSVSAFTASVERNVENDLGAVSESEQQAACLNKAVSYVASDVLDSWQALCASNKASNPPKPVNWQEFKEWLQRSYGRSNSAINTDKLLNLYQTGSLSGYTKMFQLLAGKENILSQGVLIHLFLRGLSPTAFNIVGGHKGPNQPWTSFAELIEHALEMAQKHTHNGVETAGAAVASGPGEFRQPGWVERKLRKNGGKPNGQPSGGFKHGQPSGGGSVGQPSGGFKHGQPSGASVGRPSGGGFGGSGQGSRPSGGSGNGIGNGRGAPSGGQGNGASGSGGVECFYCHELGHVKRVCPKLLQKK
jgi:hypothetical protein